MSEIAETPIVNRTSSMRRYLLAAILGGLSLLAAGCGSGGLFKQPVAPPPPVQIEAGSIFSLNVPLAFAPGSDTLYFQDSRLVSASGIARDLPYCMLAPASAAAPRRVEPNRFAVVSVDYDDKASGSAGQLQNVTRIVLASDPTQPYNLLCQWPKGAPSQAFLTSEEIEGAIGAHFSMALQR